MAVGTKTYKGALPVCRKTQRVAEVAVALYLDRWSPAMNALCSHAQKDAVACVLMIMQRVIDSSDFSGRLIRT